MRTQLEKSKEMLCDEIEKLSERPMNDAVAAKLNNYHGAYKALCMMEKEWENPEAAAKETHSADKPTRTPELDGDTEFEQIIMKIPVDTAHMTAVFNVLADHMEQLAIMNHRAYDNIMLKLREVARN